MPSHLIKVITESSTDSIDESTLTKGRLSAGSPDLRMFLSINFSNILLSVISLSQTIFSTLFSFGEPKRPHYSFRNASSIWTGEIVVGYILQSRSHDTSTQTCPDTVSAYRVIILFWGDFFVTTLFFLIVLLFSSPFSSNLNPLNKRWEQVAGLKVGWTLLIVFFTFYLQSNHAFCFYFYITFYY